jgi:hypothetical protein
VQTPQASPAPAEDNSPDKPVVDDAHAWFADVTESSGLKFQYRNGREGGHYTLLETVGGGVGMIDFDQDGDLDLFLTGGGTISTGTAGIEVKGTRSALYRNDGAWRFRDVTAEVGLDAVPDYSHGCTVLDFDADGFSDLLMTCYGQSRLYRNGGDGLFEDVTEAAGLKLRAWSTASAGADFDLDGFTDLFIVDYVKWEPSLEDRCYEETKTGRDTCPPQRYPATQNHLFRNKADGTFEDVTRAAGIRSDGKGLGVVAADLNQDGRVDLYVANDQVENHLYLGDPNGWFRDSGVAAGVSGNEYGIPEGSMGVDVADLNGDGRPDLFVTNFELEDNSLYLNRGEGLFDHGTVRWGLAGKARTLVGFGTLMTDFDADGWADLFVVNGHVAYHRGIAPWEQPAALYRNVMGRKFEEITPHGGQWFANPHAGRGLAVGDLDNDGAPDAVVSCQNELVSLLKNRNRPGSWIRLELIGTTGDRKAVGAVVRVEWNGRSTKQPVKSGQGYLSSSDSRLLFYRPAGSDDPDISVEVTWPKAHVERFQVQAAERSIHLVEGHGQTQ